MTPIYYAAVPVVAQGGAKLTAYPNPAFGGVFTVRLSSGAIEPVLFTFTNMLGEKIREITAATNAPVALALDAPGGVYFLSATTEQGSWNMQVVVQQ